MPNIKPDSLAQDIERLVRVGIHALESYNQHTADHDAVDGSGPIEPYAPQELARLEAVAAMILVAQGRLVLVDINCEVDRPERCSYCDRRPKRANDLQQDSSSKWACAECRGVDDDDG